MQRSTPGLLNALAEPVEGSTLWTGVFHPSEVMSNDRFGIRTASNRDVAASTLLDVREICDCEQGTGTRRKSRPVPVLAPRLLAREPRTRAP